MNWKNLFTETLKIQYPIIQAPMLGVSTPEMAAAVSNEGGLGSLAVGGLSPEITRQLIRKTKSLTNKPFAVNLFAHKIPAYKEDDLEPMRKLLLQLAYRKGYPLEPGDLSDFKFYNHLDQIDILIDEKIPIVSFTFACLEPENIQLLHQNECTLIGTATCLAEALYLREQNIDMIAVQGLEAGGHRGTFLENIPLPQIGIFSLLPQIAEQVPVPCIAAGGINSSDTIKAAFQLGAAAVQIGTAFIATEESVAIASYKERLGRTPDTDNVLTKAFSGRWARGIRNEMMTEIESSGVPIPPYPLQNSLTTKLRQLAQRANDAEYTNLWSGQSAEKTSILKTKDVFTSLINEYEALDD